VCSGTSALTASIDRAVGAADLLLLCRQLHYANLGGERTLARRRVELTVRAFADGAWADSAVLPIDVDPLAADQPPKLRFDDVILPLGGAVDWRPLGWYDGRQAAGELTWRIQALPAICTATGLVAGARSDQTAVLGATAQTLDWFAAAQLQLQAGTTLDSGTATIVAGDGLATATATFNIAVQPASGELEIIGDMPFAVQAGAQVRLRASRPDVRFVQCIAHPATGLSHLIQPQFTAYTGNGDILLLFDRPLSGEPLAGCAVFEAGGSAFRLPYRIAVLPGRAN
jgi:hypothetical protein